MNTYKRFSGVVLILAVLLAGFSWSASVTGTSLAETTGSILYVKPDTAGVTCADWENACGLQTALGLAADGDEIWVAEGVHYPGSNSDPRTATFQLESGVELYGGFEGTETQRDERDWDAHPAILSGDINRDGTLDGGNAYHVVTGSGVDETAILDGFTITGGKADGVSFQDQHRGGGMFNEAGNPMLINVTFSGNWAVEGGGMYNESSNPTLTGITFFGNSADGGGGMLNVSSEPILTRVVFTANWAIIGGGIYNESSTPSLIDVTFSDNSTSQMGGGMYNWDSSPALTSVTFSGNSAGNGGGISNWESSPTLTNVTFTGNSANYGGAVFNNSSSSPLLTNNIVWGNSPTSDQIYNYSGTAAITYSDIEGDYTGVGNINLDPRFVDPANGNLRLQRTSPAIDAGDNDAVPIGLTTDMDGSPRKVDIPGIPDSGSGDPPIVDMGAYEVQAGAEIIYVDRGAHGPIHDGQSWGSAFKGLQSGLAAAQDGDEIWVAEGTYYPGVIGNRNATFQLKSGVELYGGFEGTEAERDERDWDTHPTVLSGDIDRDGTLDGGNAYHVVTGSGVDGTAVLDGFTITGGKADGDFLLDQDRGGGMLNEAASPMLIYVTFSGNWAVEGGGMYNWDSSPKLTDVTFSNNEAHGSAGGMHNLSSSPILTRVIFTANNAIMGGGMYNESSSSTLIAITFSNNSASMAGGGIYNGSSSPTLTNVTFSGNSANIGGAMINNLSSSPLLTNNIVWDNSPTADQIYNNSGTATVTYSDIEGGYTGTGNIDDDPLFVDPDNGDLHLQHGSPAIDAGDNAAVPVEVTTDLDGNPRFVDIPGIPDTGVGDPPIVDMGAYEVQPYFYWVYLPMIWK